MVQSPTADELAWYLLLDEERYAAEQRARHCEQAAKEIKEVLKSYCNACGGGVTLHGHALTLVDGGAHVAWRELYTQLAGVAAASAAQRQAERRLRLVVAPID
jgi:hypothetical protein